METSYQQYIPYIIEIRKRVFFVVSLFLISAAMGFIFYEKIIALALRIFQLEGVNIVFTSPFQFMELAVSCALLVGAVTVFPLVLYQILSFVRPALSPKEYKVILYLIPVSMLLFVIGFTYGAVIMKYVVSIFYSKATELNIGNFLDISSLLSQIIITSALLGVAFQFPIVITLLIRLKVIPYKSVAKQRMPTYAGFLVFAAFLPPTDVLSLVFLVIPLILLYETTLLLNRMFKNGK